MSSINRDHDPIADQPTRPSVTADHHPLILVIDDDATTCEFARLALEAGGYRVEEAAGGAAGLDAYARLRPDMVFLDVMMPDCDGFEVCRRIRKSAAGSGVPIVFMTGLDDTDAIVQAYQAGGTDFVTKPVNGLILMHRARYLLRASLDARELAVSRAVLAQAQAIAHLGSWEWERATDRVNVSEQGCEILGLPTGGFTGGRDHLFGAVTPSIADALRSVLDDSVATAGGHNQDYRVVLPDGSERHVHIQAQPLRSEETDSAGGLIGTVQDVTDRKRAEEQIHALAHYDSLTGLPNRAFFRDRLRRAADFAKWHDAKLAVIFLDIDRFKTINDTLGHSAGDLLLKAMAERIEDSVRLSDSVCHSGSSQEPENSLARLGGDEFTVLLTGITRPEDVTRVARRMQLALSRPFTIEHREVFVTASMGIAVFPTDGDDLDVLLRNADAAMYHAKREGRNNFQFYSPSLNAAASERLALEHDLHRAVAEGELFLHFQPRIELPAGALVGVEALLRWDRHGRGLVPPAQFVPLAEEAGLMKRIDEWVLQTVCRQIRQWAADGIRNPIVSVNVSNSLFRSGTLAGLVDRLCSQYGIAPTCLEFELTETIIMQQPDAAVRMLRTIKGIGCHISIDDFGSGYSSLNHLRRFPVDVLKVDRSFLTDVVSQAEDAAIVKAIIMLGRTLGLQVVAEGVETQAQVDFLIQNGCDQAQGYFFSKPLPAQDIQAIFRAGRCHPLPGPCSEEAA